MLTICGYRRTPVSDSLQPIMETIRVPIQVEAAHNFKPDGNSGSCSVGGGKRCAEIWVL